MIIAKRKQMPPITFVFRTCAVFIASALLLTGCGSGRYQATPLGSLARGAGVEENAGGGVAVNAFLWRACLETMSFLPISSADPFGGVVLTDWYAPPETPAERFKINAYLLSSVLRADGLKITIFRQQRDSDGEWRDANVGPEVASAFENAVLTRARDLRLRATSEKY